MGHFSGISDAKTFGKGQWMEPGKYVVEIIEVKLFEGENPERPGLKYIVEFNIFESDNAEIKVGQTRSYVIPIGNTMAMSNIKGFIAACLGADPADGDNDWEQLADDSCSSEQPFAGMPMKLTCWHTDTKAGGTYTVHKWEQAS